MSRRPRPADVVLQLSAREGFHPAALGGANLRTAPEPAQHQLLELRRTGRSGERRRLRALRIAAVDAGYGSGGKAGGRAASEVRASRCRSRVALESRTRQTRCHHRVWRVRARSRLVRHGIQRRPRQCGAWRVLPVVTTLARAPDVRRQGATVLSVAADRLCSPLRSRDGGTSPKYPKPNANAARATSVMTLKGVQPRSSASSSQTTDTTRW